MKKGLENYWKSWSLWWSSDPSIRRSLPSLPVERASHHWREKDTGSDKRPKRHQRWLHIKKSGSGGTILIKVHADRRQQQNEMTHPIERSRRSTKVKVYRIATMILIQYKTSQYHFKSIFAADMATWSDLAHQTNWLHGSHVGLDHWLGRGDSEATQDQHLMKSGHHSLW